MSKIKFGQYTQVRGFNVCHKNQVDISLQKTDESIVYSTGNILQVEDKVYMEAVYRNQALSSDSCVVYRKSPADFNLTYLGSFKGVADGIIDYNVISNGVYKYIIHTNPNSDNNIVLESDYVNIHWNWWSIVSLNYNFENDVYIPDETVFLLKNNLSIGSFSDNLNVIKYNTLGEFGRVIQGEQQYDTGTISCLLGDFKVIDNKYQYTELVEKKYYDSRIYSHTYQDPMELITKWKLFLKDSKLKLLKSPKGESWIVVISDASSRDIQCSSSSYPTTINFNWQEIMDKNKISIVKW